jgi:hypothetical protein
MIRMRVTRGPVVRNRVPRACPVGLLKYLVLSGEEDLSLAVQRRRQGDGQVIVGLALDEIGAHPGLGPTAQAAWPHVPCQVDVK